MTTVFSSPVGRSSEGGRPAVGRLKERALSDGNGLLGESVHAALVGMIFTGELAPGTPLSVPALAARLDVSRSPVRDSIQRLVADGLAVHTPRAGARVARVDMAMVAEAMAVREILDEYAARQATLRATDADVARLRGMLEEQRARLDEPGSLTNAQLDLEFHTFIRDLAANAPLSEALHRLDSKSHLFNSGLWDDPFHRQVAMDEHTAIVDAIATGDAEAAARAAAAHVAAVMVRMRRLAARG